LDTLTTEESIRRFTGMNSQSIQQFIFAESGIELSKDFSGQQKKYLSGF
jgi:tRNA(His) 5'-end guanylyltransferase